MVADYDLTVVNVPPAYWHQWAQACVEASDLAPNTQLRLAIIGGDIVLPETLALWHRTPMRAARLLNAYGPTETTITATTFEVPLQSDALWCRQRVPIGRPLVNRTAYILDRCGNPVPIGVPGELYIGGAGLARGYLDRPELDAVKFIADPFSAEPAARLYRTGDLACYRPDGNIEFLGRLDQQVKIRGIRVELGEIEAALNQHPAVRDAIALVWDQEIRGRQGTDRPLVAYIALHPGESLTVGELQGFLREKLPAFMLPSAYMFLESLPINVSGKLDRRALPAPDLTRPDLTAPFVAPRTPVEEELARIWAQVLGVERVGIHDNFFELGGHSLLATQLISRLRDVFQVELPLRRFFEVSTVAGLAVALAQCQAEQAGSDQVAQLLAELEQLPEDEARVMLANGTLSQ
jgi:non-ribosomal peptide synthetase component F